MRQLYFSLNFALSKNVNFQIQNTSSTEHYSQFGKKLLKIKQVLFKVKFRIETKFLGTIDSYLSLFL